MKLSGHPLGCKSRILVSLSVDDETSPFLAVKVSFKVRLTHLVLFLSKQVRSTSVHRILSGTVASNQSYSVLKWYYDENRIFPIEAILKHKQLVLVCTRIKMLFTFFKYLFSFHLPKVIHNTSLRFCCHGNILGSRPPHSMRHFWPPSAFHFHNCKWCLMIPQTYYKYVSLWPHLVFFKLKIGNMFKSSGRGQEKSELSWEQNFYSCRGVSCRTINLSSCNGLHCKLAKIALFIYLR